MQKFDFSEYIMPMAAASYRQTKTSTEVVDLLGYIGTCFFVDGFGTVATCAHCIENVDFTKNIVVGLNLKSMTNKDFVLINDFSVPDRMDIAFGKTNIQGNKFIKPYKGALEMGFDVMCLGFNLNASTSENIEISPRLSKGHIVRLFSKSDQRLRCLSQCELSFPVVSGFSGAPVLSMNNRLVGMAYSNYESKINVFQSEEIIEEGNNSHVKVKETISRVLEFGLMHPVSDILRMYNSIMTPGHNIVQ